MEPRTWLQQERVKVNKTQEDVANAAGIKRPYYTQIESGVRRPSVEVAQKIANYIGFNWVLFFDKKCSDKRQNANTA